MHFRPPSLSSFLPQGYHPTELLYSPHPLLHPSFGSETIALFSYLATWRRLAFSLGDKDWEEGKKINNPGLILIFYQEKKKRKEKKKMRSQGIFKTSGPLHPHWVLILKWSMCYNILMLQCSQDLQVETFRGDPVSLPQSTGWAELRGERYPLGQSTPRAVSIVTMGICCRLNQECLPWLSNPGLVLLGVGRHLKRLPWWRAEITGDTPLRRTWGPLSADLSLVCIPARRWLVSSFAVTWELWRQFD